MQIKCADDVICEEIRLLLDLISLSWLDVLKRYVACESAGDWKGRLARPLTSKLVGAVVREKHSERLMA